MAKIKKYKETCSIKKIKRPWSALAAAIIQSAINEGDDWFFETEWYETLKALALCAEDTSSDKVLHLPKTTSYKE